MGLSLEGAVKLLKECHGIKMNRTELYKIEKGLISCNVEKFIALCDIFDVEPNKVLDWRD